MFARIRRSRLLLGLVITAGVAGFAGLSWARRPETSPAGRGERLVVANGCYACHGRSDVDLRANFRVMPNGDWRAKGNPTFWENGVERADIIREWIRDGCVATKKEKHKEFFIQMPAYGGKHLNEGEIDAIAAWILAESLRLGNGAGNGGAPMPSLSPDAVQALTEAEVMALGDRLSRRQGCYQCHGESGQGGVSNPRSFKGYIPGFFGNDFLELTDHGKPEEILHWINHGRGRAIESGPLGRVAKYFLNGQAIPMPAYDARLSEGDKTLLVRFLLLLNQKGALTSEQFQAKIQEFRAALKPARH